MSTIDTVLLGARLVLYVIGLVVVVFAVGTIVDHLGNRLAGDPE